MDPLPPDLVYLLQRDLGHESLVKLVFVLDSGDRLIVQEGPDILRGITARTPGFPVGVRALDTPEQGDLLTLELGRDEAEARNPLGLGENDLEPPLDPVLGHRGLQKVRTLRAHEAPLLRAGKHKRRVGLPGDVAQAQVEHAVVQRLDQPLPVSAYCRLLLHFHLVIHGDAGRRHLLVGDDREQGLIVVGNRIFQTLPRVLRSDNPLEVLEEKGLHVGPVEVADHNDPHQVGPVPIFVEAPESFVLEGLEALNRSYDRALCVPRPLQDHGELLVLNSRAGATTQPPLLHDYPSFLIDLVGIQREPVRPVFHDLEGGGHHVPRVGRDLNPIAGLVVAGRGVDARA